MGSSAEREGILLLAVRTFYRCTATTTAVPTRLDVLLVKGRGRGDLRSVQEHSSSSINPFRTAVPFWGQTT